MRTDDLRGGPLKALLLFLLIAANVFAALSHDGGRARRQGQTLNAAPATVHAEPALPEKHPH